MTATSWRAHSHVFLWRHASACVALLAISLVAIGLLTWALHRSEAALAQARESLHQQRSHRTTEPAPSPGPDDAARVFAMRAVLNNTAAPHSVVRQLAALSQAAGMDWAQGDYRSQWHAQTKITQWQVTQPVQTTYPQLRRLIDGVLRAHPNVSLDEISLERDGTTQTMLQVRLRWSIWTVGNTPIERPASVGER